MVDAVPSAAPEAGVDVEVTPARECAVDDRVLEDDATDSAGGEWLARDVEAGHARAAAGRGDRGREHADRGRFACSVGAEEAEYFPGGDLEGDALHGFDA